jgi:carboxypeptidase family protein
VPLKPSFYIGLMLSVFLGLAALAILSTGGVVIPPTLPVNPVTPRNPAPPRAAAPRTPEVAESEVAHQTPGPDASAAEPGQGPRPEPTPAPTPPPPPVGKIYGSVLDPSHHPVAGATVTLTHRLGRLSAVTDEYGHFRFTPLPEGSFLVRAFHVDFAPLVERARGTVVQLEQGESRHVSLSLRKGLVVEGVVVARDGSGPVGGARVTMARAEYERYLSTSTRADGTFRFDHFPVLPEGERPFPIEVMKKGFAPEFTSLEPRRETDVPRLEIQLDRGAAIHGEVTDVQGAPLTGVHVRCKYRYLYLRQFAETTGQTDNLGRYRIDHLPHAFAIQVWAFKKGFRPTYLNLILSDRDRQKRMRPIRLQPEHQP